MCLKTTYLLLATIITASLFPAGTVDAQANLRPEAKDPVDLRKKEDPCRAAKDYLVKKLPFHEVAIRKMSCNDAIKQAEFYGFNQGGEPTKEAKKKGAEESDASAVKVPTTGTSVLGRKAYKGMTGRDLPRIPGQTKIAVQNVEATFGPAAPVIGDSIGQMGQDILEMLKGSDATQATQAAEATGAGHTDFNAILWRHEQNTRGVADLFAPERGQTPVYLNHPIDLRDPKTSPRNRLSSSEPANDLIQRLRPSFLTVNQALSTGNFDLLHNVARDQIQVLDAHFMPHGEPSE